MTGWRVGFAIGGASMIAALGQVKANTDSGIFTAIQYAAKTALDEYATLTPPILRPLQGPPRRLRRGAEESGLGRAHSRGHLLRLDPLPQRLHIDTTLCRLLEEANVVTTPGLGFGRTADGYIRVALTVDTPRLLEAVDRIGKLSV